MAAELLNDLCMDLWCKLIFQSWSKTQKSFQSGHVLGLGLTDGPALRHVGKFPLNVSSLPGCESDSVSDNTTRDFPHLLLQSG